MDKLRENIKAVHRQLDADLAAGDPKAKAFASAMRGEIKAARKSLGLEPLPSNKSMTSYQVSIAAEAFAACVLAHSGCDVGIQYGANQPGHDLVVTRGRHALKVSVKGSQDGGWGLIQKSKNSSVSYSEAADHWCRKQSPDVVLCLVQFEGVSLGGAPRCYFAWPDEIASHLQKSRGGLGDTVLYENHTFRSGKANGVTDKLPDSWKVSAKRIDELFLRH